MIDKMRELITNYVDVSPAEISEDSKFIDDLGFNSYDFRSFLGEIEDEFDKTASCKIKRKHNS